MEPDFAQTNRRSSLSRYPSLLRFEPRFDPDGLIESAVGKTIRDEQAYRDLGGQAFDGFSAYRRTA